MRSMLFFKTKTPPNTQTQERGQFNSSTFRGTWRKPMYTDKSNAHVYRRRFAHLFMYTFFPPPSFLNVYRINSKRYYFNPQKQISSP